MNLVSALGREADIMNLIVQVLSFGRFNRWTDLITELVVLHDTVDVRFKLFGTQHCRAGIS